MIRRIAPCCARWRKPAHEVVVACNRILRGFAVLWPCATRGPARRSRRALSDPQSIARAGRTRRIASSGWRARDGHLKPRRHQQCGQGRQWPDRLATERGDLRGLPEAPVTRQSWRLSGDVHSEAGTLEGWRAGPRHSEDAEALLLGATVGYSRQCAGPMGVGLRRKVSRWKCARSPRGHLQSCSRPGGASTNAVVRGPGSQPALPSRIEAAGTTVVRLIVDRWDFTAP